MIASVYILDIPYHADKAYDYTVSSELAERISKGTFVIVPFGGGNKKKNAVVVSLHPEESDDAQRNMKPVLAVSKTRLSLSEEMLGLCFFIKEHTLCTYGDAVRTVMPATLSRVGEIYCITDQKIAAEDLAKLPPKTQHVYGLIAMKGRISEEHLKEAVDGSITTALKSLVNSGYITREVSESGGARDKLIKKITLSLPDDVPYETILAKQRSIGQKEILNALIRHSTINKDVTLTDNELLALSGSNRTQLNALIEKGLVRVTEEESFRDPYAGIGGEEKTFALSAAQQTAFDEIAALYDTGEPRAALLHGITGSGKTQVIKAMIDHVIQSGRTVIVLVPEIALTPQTVNVFAGHYKDRMVVIHSSLSAGERYDAWKRIDAGGVDVVVGTRSAIFAPLKNLGMIVIDEEQEHTYKSDTDPKYLAHDIARYRCGVSKSLMLLSSATPSVTSYYKAVSGTYKLIPLTERYGGATLPAVEICDMRESAAPGMSVFSERLIERIHAAKTKDEQAILFINRRGYNSHISCRSCGEPIECPHCSVALTYHAKNVLLTESGAEPGLSARTEGGVLACHYCGYRTRVPNKCPACGSEHISFGGCGTQRAEEELHKILPNIRTLRMDADTTAAKFAHDDILTKFRNKEADALLGTQMVVKGHDFPKVTLVGVINADSALYLDDFRAAEHAFSMIVQIAGRAGRAGDPGTALIQTMNPDSEVIRLAAKQDYVSFYNKEIRLREALLFPPFCDIAVITLSSQDEALLEIASTRLNDVVLSLIRKDYSDMPLTVFGPFEAPIYRVNKKYRMRMVIKCRLNKRMRGFFDEILCVFRRNGGKRLNISVDFNPSSL